MYWVARDLPGAPSAGRRLSWALRRGCVFVGGGLLGTRGFASLSRLSSAAAGLPGAPPFVGLTLRAWCCGVWCGLVLTDVQPTSGKKLVIGGRFNMQLSGASEVCKYWVTWTWHGIAGAGSAELFTVSPTFQNNFHHFHLFHPLSTNSPRDHVLWFQPFWSTRFDSIQVIFPRPS